jgi:hypothetical protein
VRVEAENPTASEIVFVQVKSSDGASVGQPNGVGLRGTYAVEVVFVNPVPDAHDAVPSCPSKDEVK